MDVELLSKMIRELVLDHDAVGLPGIGTFVAEEVPASFSDRGFTINPPYRKLTFHSGRPEDDLLVSFYAASNSVEADAAKAIVTQFLTEMKEALKDRKVITLPGLGRLRATRENAFFFVSDPDLDIFPEGYGLEPLSLRFHRTDTVLPEVPASVAETPSAEEPAPSSVPEVTEAPEVPETPESTEAPEASVAPETAEAPEIPTTPAVPRRRRRWWIPFVVLIVLAAVALAVFMILAQVAPDFIDSILYTPEELRIINY